MARQARRDRGDEDDDGVHHDDASDSDDEHDTVHDDARRHRGSDLSGDDGGVRGDVCVLHALRQQREQRRS